MARELLIQDGKLTSDLDADHKTIKNLEGFAALDESGKVPASQLPSYVDDVLEFPATTDFPATGETDKIYVATSTGKVYRWSGSQYIEIANPDLSGYVNGGSYDSTGKKILLKHDSSTIAEIDATAFIKDGMVSSVAISNGKLVITFNTDAGLDPIEIPLTDIFNPANYYDKTATNTLLSGKADRVANATSGNLAALDENGNLTDSGMALRDFAVAESLAPVFVTGYAYEVGDLCTSFDNDEQHKGAWLYKCILATDGSQPTWPETDPTHWALATVEDLLAALRTALSGKADASSLAPVATSGNYDDLTNKPGNVSAFANDAGYLTSHQQLRYAMPESVALVAENDAATLVCADRAVTNATIVTGFSTLNLSFPAAVSGYVRDFYLRITVAAGESSPAISVPQGITIENAGGAVPEIAGGAASAAATTLVWFSETAPGVFTAKSETVKAVV